MAAQAACSTGFGWRVIAGRVFRAGKPNATVGNPVKLEKPVIKGLFGSLSQGLEATVRDHD